MLRARRLVAMPAGASVLLRAAPRGTRRANATAIASMAAAPRSRFHSVALTQPRRRLPLTPSLMQLRWRSELSAAQQDQVNQYMDELTTCRDTGKWRQALKLLDRIDREGYRLDSAMYELAIAACARMGKIDVLGGLLQNMDADSLLPTNRTVDFIMQAYIAAEEWKLIVDLAQDTTAKGVALSEAAFEAAFESCGKLRDAGSARQILLNLEQTQARELDNEIFATAIRACGMGGRPDHAASLFAHMEDKCGLEADADTFNQLIRAQIVNHAYPQALQTFALVKERGVLLTESIYTATIDALIHRGEFRQASQLFDQMLSCDLEPSVFCLGRMMFAFVRLNNHDDARVCWSRILESDEIAPSMIKYSKMMELLATTNDSELAVTVFEHMCTRFDPARILDKTYASAIRAYGRLGQTETALALFDEFYANRQRSGQPMPRSARIYLAVFNALSRDAERDPEENTRDAQRVWDVMVQSVPQVMAPAYASLANVLASSGDLTAIEDLMQHARESAAQSQRREVSAGRKGGAMRADQGYFFDEEDLDEEMTTNEALYEGLDNRGDEWHEELMLIGVISGLSKARTDQSARVMAYLNLMRERGLPINDSIVRASTDAFIKNEQWSLMLDLLEYVDSRTLDNAELCFGDTVSKLLEAEAWEAARIWLAKAHRLGLQLPIRGKRDVLERLQAIQSDEWQIAYALARETLNFKQMVQANVDSVANAVDVCSKALRTDLVVKLFERTSGHPSLTRVVRLHSDERDGGGDEIAKIPLRMYKQTLLACMREHTTNYSGNSRIFIDKAEAICAQMLQQARASAALDGDALSMAISIKATMGDDDDVLALFEKMQEHEVSGNSYAYNAALMAYSRSRRLDKVLEIRDQLCDANSPVLLEPKITQSLLFSLAILNDEELMNKHLTETMAKLPHITKEHVVSAFLHANRYAKCVEWFDETVSDKMLYLILRRMIGTEETSAGVDQDGPDDAAAARLLLKYIAIHGLDRVQPPGWVLKVSKHMVQCGHLQEAQAILSLFADPACEVALTDLKPSFQREVMELQLYVHGEQRQLTQLCELFEQTKPTQFALTPRHYQLAMEYCSAAKVTKTKKDAVKTKQDGAQACLRLFETLRQQFVNPNGAIYWHTLQSCVRLEQLETVGPRIFGDAVAQGCERELSTELFRMARKAVAERQELLESTSDVEGEAPAKTPRRRGAPRKNMAAKQFQVDVDELVAITRFGHHNGVEISAGLAQKLLELRAFLPADVLNELEYIASQEQQTRPRGRESSVASPRRSPRARAPLPRSPKRTSRAGSAGSRWGDFYLQHQEE
ncbi:hypothetical protein Poli38472_003535 [Pythium oligandrum]|uniref:Uncharacterized protein n=1 Tax=Pythium oligandrum TaxID=41045 RepID=A0A8K1C702_PYTOL|nr:hypothetical protein Poli38472_003535 [Pythium oligandrum]|eukprot:TMW57610.1 hypothetical protein Poli38472_003535 [Pythium oligandrum]